MTPRATWPPTPKQRAKMIHSRITNNSACNRTERKEHCRREGELGGRGFGRFDFRRGNQTGQVIRHKIQRLFTTVSAAPLFTTLHR
jgi:hypothetical protein